MAGKKARIPSRKATPGQALAMAQACAGMTAGPDTGLQGWDAVYADLPDEERDSLKKVDFSVLDRDLMDINILDGESARLLSGEQLYSYIGELEKCLRFYVQQYSDVAEELTSAMELILNQRNDMFGRSSQRSSALFGAQDQKGDGAGSTDDDAGQDAAVGADRENRAATEQGGQGLAQHAADLPDPGRKDAGNDGSDGSPGGEGQAGEKPKGKPRRSDGCAQKVYKNAEVHHIQCTIPESRLDELFGKNGWKDMPCAEKISAEYSIIPAKVVVKLYHLHAYCAKDCTAPVERAVARALLPITRPRRKSPISGSFMAQILHYRNSMRIPVDRICSMLQSQGLDVRPQRVYENLGHYDRYFHILLERMWEKLLGSRYIQIDETPVRFYDKKEGCVRRGYAWVFTTSEMLIGGRPLTLFYFAHGRGAEVLRTCLRGFKGVIGSDGHSAYHVFARESGGEVTNAGCLDHFRKRLVAALRAIPGLRQMTEEEKLRIPAYAIMLKLNEVFRLERKTKDMPTKEERDAYRKGPVRRAFDELVEAALGADTSRCPAGSYTCKAVRYMENQEVYLREFLEDSNIAGNNSKCERKFAFFAILRNQIKMFGSEKGAVIAAELESIEQTAREYIPSTRIYYQFLIDKLCPFIDEQGLEADFSNMEELDRFMPWSDEYKSYEARVLERERVLVPLAEYL